MMEKGAKKEGDNGESLADFIALDRYSCAGAGSAQAQLDYAGEVLGPAQLDFERGRCSCRHLLALRSLFLLPSGWAGGLLKRRLRQLR